MKLDIRPMLASETMYAFVQNSQIAAQTGWIGYLAVNMGDDGYGFCSSWTDKDKSMKSLDFTNEFDMVINSLREEGYFLQNRGALRHYCSSHPEALIQQDREGYGVRVDTDGKYTYLFRLYPEKTGPDLFCFCYVKSWLDQHIAQAEKGIRFITPEYKEVFRLNDGEKIRITKPDGSYHDEVCRYLDDYHLTVGNNIYHICEFAERIKANGITVSPVLAANTNPTYEQDTNSVKAMHSRDVAELMFRHFSLLPKIEFYLTKESDGTYSGGCELSTIVFADSAMVIGNYAGGGCPFCYDMTGDTDESGFDDALSVWLRDIGCDREDENLVLYADKIVNRRELAPEVTIVIEGGMMQAVYSTVSEMVVTLIDKDVTDPDEIKSVDDALDLLEEDIKKGTVSRQW